MMSKNRNIIPAHTLFRAGKSIYIPLFCAEKNQKRQIVFELELENGERSSGIVKRNRIQIVPLPIGSHKLTLIVGQPILVKKTKIYHTIINVTE